MMVLTIYVCSERKIDTILDKTSQSKFCMKIRSLPLSSGPRRQRVRKHSSLPGWIASWPPVPLLGLLGCHPLIFARPRVCARRIWPERGHKRPSLKPLSQDPDGLSVSRLQNSIISLSLTIILAELFNIPDWDCKDTVKAPYERLERLEHTCGSLRMLTPIFNTRGHGKLRLSRWQ